MDFLSEEEKQRLKEHDKELSAEVLVRNLPFQVREHELKQYCERNFGHVLICVVKTHKGGKYKGQSKGHANVLFESTAAARNMVNASLVLGNRILVARALPHRDAELYYSQHTTNFPLAGLRLGSWAARDHFEFVSEIPGRSYCDFQMKEKKVVITYTWLLTYELVFSFKDLSDRIVLEKWGDSQIIAYLSLKRPPKIYRVNSDDERDRVCDFTGQQILIFTSAYQLIFQSNIHDLEFVMLNLARFNLTDDPLKFAYPFIRVSSWRIVTRDLSPFVSKLPYHLRFKVEALINSWKIPDPRIHASIPEFERFIDFLWQNRESAALEPSLSFMVYAESPVVFDLVATFQKCMVAARTIKADKDYMEMARVIITPTKIHLVGPEMEVSNRVIREYQQYSSHFIRVSFTDENLCQIMGGLSDQVGNRFKAIFTNGIQIAGRTFEFLAYSSSQLREHGCWFFSPVNGITADSIRRWMGDFSGINIVAKYAARMGQCFSTTFETCEVLIIDKKEIPDITTSDSIFAMLWGNKKQYTFSDGIGQISSPFAKEIAAKLSLSHVPSAFQFRLGGCKGMVAVNPRARHKLYIRPSMRKFDSNHSVFEVIGYSHFITSYLNRQIIVLLSNLGVPNHAFERLQDEMVSKLNSMFTDNITAKEILKIMPDQHDFSSTALKMVKGGFSVQKEPFLCNLLRAMYTKKMLDLKLKARILLKESACLIGVLDETKSLQYGQVFLKVNLPGTKTPTIIKGPVFVVKNPAFHPGDIRRLEAVDCPSLHHLVDCLVFPATGPRPHTSETSGSDLDGDIYTVCWDKTLIPNNHVFPGEYESPQPIMRAQVTMADIHNFFIEYMKNDCLGRIANTHLAVADASVLGPKDPKCLQLTELHSVAVDYPKTGVAAELPRSLRVDPKVGYPDFMEKKGKPQYISNKTLGVLYRKIHPIRVPSVPVTFDRDLIVSGYEEYLELAEQTKKDYNFHTITLMNQYGVKTEGELVSGCVTKLGTQFLKKKFFDHIQRMCQAVYAMKKQFRAQFEEELRAIPLDELEQHKRAKASAWYIVTYWPDYREQETGPRARELLGFPWIMVDVLARIKKEKIVKL